ncbi:tRNA 2-selenouridine(34) synthase MnmH [Janthinobacterium agaricidamnosum]|uniref:tRNA 2-selenouridine synthase n=1 Tax=Janthinobacterium agaricidamnosum NBRC 102515 = DSM 9628 TaxID=1349767 RepID=W0V2I4_9BURK|nr:tRNA 2-selenouridine(34) synthase MnmH [Janthinobacterium agaricidamnosum]CDG83029.1 tRNA 2-selenouridine synthase [Janthinobacterium agaricidamnosum NBRC 102515 = DSM 9628]
MKYPEILGFDQVLPQLGSFDTIIDARSPSEFALDHVPGAINCPVLDDVQRIEVGTLYKQVSAFDAKKVGAAMIAKNIGHYIDTLWRGQPREWRPLVYCWRGGNRSGAMVHILARIGWPVVQLEGGYKAYRNHVNQALALPPQAHFKVICGSTGSGKSRLLETLAASGAQVLDLEQLAAHRGSVLGNLPSQPQPSQKAFESAIWQRLRGFDTARPVFVEAESRKIGALRIPDALMEHMRASSCIALELPREQRVRLLMEDYAHFTQHPAVLNAQLDCLLSLYGRDKIGRWQAMAQAGQMAPLVEELLVQHYDPAYAKSIDRNFLQYSHAESLLLDDISAAAFSAAALRLNCA